MMLAQAWAEHPVELRADLQMHYGLNLDRLGVDFDLWHAAACVSCLPLGSCLMSAFDERCSWTRSDLLAHMCLQALCGAKEIRPPFDDGSGGSNGPMPEIKPMTVDEFEAWHSQEWKEVDGWEVQ